MVVLLTVPKTKTLSPVVTALADVEFVPFRYVVADASLTVTFWPADVVMVKLGADTLSTVPDAPPSAGADRALDPPAPGFPVRDGAAGDVADADEDAAGAAEVAAHPAETPITAHISAPATIHRLLPFDGFRDLRGRTARGLAGSWSFIIGSSAQAAKQLGS
jgi:hypothetical protein